MISRWSMDPKKIVPVKVYPEMCKAALMALAEFIDPRAPFFDLYPEALEYIVNINYDEEKRTVYDLKHSRYDDPFIDGTTATWYRFGFPHRDHGPAVISISNDPVADVDLWKTVVYKYYHRGLLHRDNAPAVVSYHKEEWHSFGKQFRAGNKKVYFPGLKKRIEDLTDFERKVITIRSNSCGFYIALWAYHYALKSPDIPKSIYYMDKVNDDFSDPQSDIRDPITNVRYRHMIGSCLYRRYQWLAWSRGTYYKPVPEPATRDRRLEIDKNCADIVACLIALR